MWQWQYLRAQEIARERLAEADEWRRARTVARVQQSPRGRSQQSARGVRRTFPSAEAGL
jgi:hypothetical protein